ncbi:MAG: SHOCT domain-containing protein [Dethiobacter sp.]|nr:SHOCT domain-containing protein [Dethiobacter sp.]
MVFDFKDYEKFNELIPQKAFTIVNTIKTNDIIDSVLNESTGSNILDQIRELAKLKDEGILTEEEFSNKKKELLARIS